MAATEERNFLQWAARVWDRLPREEVKLQEIETRPEYQPRDPSVIEGEVARFRQRQSLDEMVDQMVTFLKTSSDNHTDPLWLVELDGKKVLVDGHHRLEAYSRTKRRIVPAKVYRGKNALQVARLSCRLANVRGSRIQLHPHEIREAVWQTLRELSADGQRTWEEIRADGYSYRSLLSQFGGQPSLGTLSSMIGHLRQVRQECLPEMGEWPTWKEYRKWLAEKHLDPDGEKESDYDVEKLADQLARRVEKLPPYVRLSVYKRIEELLGEVDEEEMKAMGIEPEERFSPAEDLF